MVERRGVTLVCGAVPSMVESETPSAVAVLNGPLACLYSIGGDCLQGHHANILCSQHLNDCVIIVSLLSCASNHALQW